jgi:predicted nucleotidyltransferase
MSAFSNRLSISPERPVDPTTLSILELIDRLLHNAKIPYMLVGATARDLLLYNVFGHAVTRATYDLDYAILVDSWDQFAIVKQMFLNIPGFTDKGREAQRLYYRPAGATFEIIIDIIPFGKLETADRTIAWPPMNVVAFTDVFESSVVVEVHSGLSIPITSLPGLIVLKLFAWLDRHYDRDVQDIRKLLETYTDAGNVDRLYEEEADELVRVGHDAILAGAFLLGKDARCITDGDVRQRLSKLLSGKKLEELVQQLARAMSVLEDRTESAEALLTGFFRGMGLDLLS